MQRATAAREGLRAALPGSVISGDTPNYEYRGPPSTVTKDGRAFGTMRPERRFYKASQQPTSHVAIHSMLAEDLYVVLAGLDQETGKAIIEVYVNPLVMLGVDGRRRSVSSERCWPSSPAAWSVKWRKFARPRN